MGRHDKSLICQKSMRIIQIYFGILRLEVNWICWNLIAINWWRLESTLHLKQFLLIFIVMLIIFFLDYFFPLRKISRFLIRNSFSNTNQEEIITIQILSVFDEPVGFLTVTYYCLSTDIVLIFRFSMTALQFISIAFSVNSLNLFLSIFVLSSQFFW